jgi:hypothetical protein
MSARLGATSQKFGARPSPLLADLDVTTFDWKAGLDQVLRRHAAK